MAICIAHDITDDVNDLNSCLDCNDTSLNDISLKLKKKNS